MKWIILFTLSGYFGSFSIRFIIFFEIEMSHKTYKRSLIENSADEKRLLKMIGLFCSKMSAAETISHIFTLTFIWYNGLFEKRQAEQSRWTDSGRTDGTVTGSMWADSLRVWRCRLDLGIYLTSVLVDSWADKTHVSHSYSPGAWLSWAKRFDSDTENQPMKK